MAALLPIKTWSWTTNQVVAFNATTIYSGGDIVNTHKLLLIGLYADMIANGWTIVDSCDSVTVSSSNLLLLVADLRFASPVGSAHSWIVLRQTATGMYVLWNHEFGNDGGSDHNMEMYVSRNAFSGGTTTARPTATEEAFVRRGQASGLLDKWHRGTSGEDWRWHHWYSSDGTITMIACYQVGWLRSWWYFGEMRFAPEGWAEPWTISMAPGGSHLIDFWDYDSNWNSEETQAVYGPDLIFNNGAFPYLTTYMIDNDSGAATNPVFRQITAVNPTSGKIDVFPAGLFLTADGFYGQCGYYFDLYYSGVGASGAIHTDSAGNKWVKIGSDGGVYVPWHASDSFLTT